MSLAAAFASLLLLASQEDLPLLTMTVHAAPDVTIEHTIEITAQREQTAATREDWARDYRWQATRRSTRGVDVISSATCPQLREAVIRFQQLPPIAPATPATVVLDEPLPLDVIALSGAPVTLRYRTFAGATVQVSGSESYGVWGALTFNALLNCWAPLLP